MLVILGALAVAWLIIWLARRRRPAVAQEPRAFTRAEIAAYRTALPKYLLAAAFCLLLGGLHNLLVQLPPVRLWLVGSGEAAHLLVDVLEEQLVVVGGAVMLTMGLICYALPALIGRPLRDHNLARLSFILTLAGVLLTSLMTAAIGLLEGIYIQRGGTYAEAHDWLGLWEHFPLWLFQGVRDAGYWTFALLIVLTILSSRNVLWPRHRRQLTTWLLLAAAAFFLAVWHRTFLELPDNPLVPLPGEAPHLVNYQAYTHLHLGLGALLPVALATFVYLLERRAEHRPDWQRAHRQLGALAIAGTLFYLARLGLGLATSATFPLPEVIRSWGWLILAATSLAFLAAFVVYAADAIRLARASRSYLPRAITGTLTLGLVLAIVAGLHGAALSLFQPGPGMPVTQAHGELAMGAMVLLPALTLADTLLLDTPGASLTARLAQAGLGFLGAGLVLGYLARLGLGGPAGLLAAAGLQLAGFATFALRTYQATGSYRRLLCERLQALPPAPPKSAALRLLELPLSQLLLIELLAALAGFPGFGWLFAGYTLTGMLLLYAGPGVAWALLPSLFALSEEWSLHLSWSTLLLYLPLSALGSTLALRSLLRRRERARPAPHPRPLSSEEREGAVPSPLEGREERTLAGGTERSLPGRGQGEG